MKLPILNEFLFTSNRSTICLLNKPTQFLFFGNSRIIVVNYAKNEIIFYFAFEWNWKDYQEKKNNVGIYLMREQHLVG